MTPPSQTVSTIDANSSLTSKIVSVLLLVHIIINPIIAAYSGRSALAIFLATAVLALPTCFIALRYPYAIATRFIVTFALTSMPIILLCATRSYWQNDMHMYFFATLAILVAYVDWRCIIMATVMTALHHFILDILAPDLVFGAEGSFLRVVVHAVILLLEAGTLCWICVGLLKRLQISIDSAEAALAQSQRMQLEAEHALTIAQESKRAEQLSQKATEEALQGAKAMEELRQLQEQSKTQEQELRLTLAASFNEAVAQAVRGIDEEVNSVAQNTHSAFAEVQNSLSKSEIITLASRNSSEASKSLTAATDNLALTVAQIIKSTDAASHSVEEASNAAQATEAVVGQLTRAFDDISGITDIIVEITEQINLLSLNAAIEAARAGDAGRGFAVVASEVRNLADRTNKATVDIRNKITAVGKVSESATTVIIGITQAVARVNALTQEIAEAVHSQSIASEGIVASNHQAAEGVYETSQQIDELVSSNHRINDSMTRTVDATGILKDSTEALKDQIAKFLTDLRA